MEDSMTSHCTHTHTHTHQHTFTHACTCLWPHASAYWHTTPAHNTLCLSLSLCLSHAHSHAHICTHPFTQTHTHTDGINNTANVCTVYDWVLNVWGIECKGHQAHSNFQRCEGWVENTLSFYRNVKMFSYQGRCLHLRLVSLHVSWLDPIFPFWLSCGLLVRHTTSSFHSNYLCLPLNVLFLDFISHRQNSPQKIT